MTLHPLGHRDGAQSLPDLLTSCRWGRGGEAGERDVKDLGPRDRHALLFAQHSPLTHDTG